MNGALSTAPVAAQAVSGGVSAFAGLVTGRGRWPAGVNEWSRGAATGTERATSGIPVVLVPGSFVPGEFYWHRLVPGLIADGHPVYACNLPGVGTRRPARQVAALEQFLTRVRDATGTDAVILVGQSFGGVIIRDLLRTTTADVRAAVLVSSQNHGFRPLWSRVFTAPGMRSIVGVVCPMALDLIPGSGYLADLDAVPPAVPTTTITSTRDAFAAPGSVAVAGADNIVLQELDPGVRSGHMLIGFDPVAIDRIRSAIASVA
ncbi:alpha/beta fold hydrolase [Gordonia sp. X0973]|uniref:alpha/beta fold hydrolase n=1 Tax=Gordonia sp. X0973 TaxID=2742602 RepID=UPI0013EDF442|nr:alpha/beta fold hydrolase [Gordonia sp. X0973]QKT07748.1 alpha/beta fold hydrolase [Gordonia sp. X0973]